MEKVTAQAVLRSAAAWLDAPEPPDAESVAEGGTCGDDAASARVALESLGFTVGDGSAATLTFEGDAALFEAVFGTTLVAATGVQTAMSYWQPTSPIVVPDELRGVISAVVLPIEPKYF